MIPVRSNINQTRDTYYKVTNNGGYNTYIYIYTHTYTQTYVYIYIIIQKSVKQDYKHLHWYPQHIPKHPWCSPSAKALIRSARRFHAMLQGLHRRGRSLLPWSPSWSRLGTCSNIITFLKKKKCSRGSKNRKHFPSKFRMDASPNGFMWILGK